jgi:phenylpyruvate tautomerase PptA (4-oxalocrotonate tautomerase family)
MISKITGKPESYIQIALEGVDQMYFGGSDAPSAFVELKALGLPTGKTKELSQQICEFLERELGLEGKRIFIVFSPCEGNLWGWNGSTFA